MKEMSMLPLLFTLGSLGLVTGTPSPPLTPPPTETSDDDTMIIIVGVALGVVILLLCIFLVYLNVKIGEKNADIKECESEVDKLKLMLARGFKDVKNVVTGTGKELVKLADDKTADAAAAATKASSVAASAAGTATDAVIKVVKTEKNTNGTVSGP